MTGDRPPGQVASAAKTLGTLALLTLALPVNAALTASVLVAGVVAGAIRRPPSPQAVDRKTVLVSGGKMTKALQLCRSFHAAGHRVLLVESPKYRFTGHRFSRCVDGFHSIPDPHEDGYAAALLDLVEREGVDLYVPVCSPVASLADARAKKLLSTRCEVLHLDADVLERLDDKHQFSQTAQALGLRVPETHRVTDARQVLDFDFAHGSWPYILKSIAYDPVHRLDLTHLPFGPPEEMAAFVESLPISPENPWILQEFVEGAEYCTHSTVRDGRVQVFCCCESSASQLNYAMVDHPGIRSWVEQFSGGLGLTGQVSFDFIETRDGVLYAIECNPRTHSAITMLYDHEGLAPAYLGDGDDQGVVVPTPQSRPTYWIYHEVWRLLTRPGRAARWRTIRAGKDAIFDWRDPLPFLMVHHLQIPWLLVQNLRRRGAWVRVDFNIGKLVEPAGD